MREMGNGKGRKGRKRRGGGWGLGKKMNSARGPTMFKNKKIICCKGGRHCGLSCIDKVKKGGWRCTQFQRFLPNPSKLHISQFLYKGLLAHKFKTSNIGETYGGKERKEERIER